MSRRNDIQMISDAGVTKPSHSNVAIKNMGHQFESRQNIYSKKEGVSKVTSSTQLPVHIIQAVPSAGDNNQVRKIIQLVKSDKVISPSNLIKIKTPLNSPMKAGKKFIGFSPGTKIFTTNNPSKLKVGETIKLKQPTSNNSTMSTTPTKVISFPMNPTSSAVLFPCSTSTMSSSCYSTTTPAMVVQSGNLISSSPMRSKVASTWSQSPMKNKRPAALEQCQTIESKRRRTPTNGEKGGKGLRHFAMLVCEKVKQKVTTTYNEVADELVSDYAERQKYHHPEQQYDQKNIRRRVYDALNVLMAMNIIYKDKKDIHWVGLPTNSAQEVQALQSEKTRKEQRIQQKTNQLHELILQQIAFKNLVQRNKRLQESRGPPPENSSIQLPFIIVNTSKKTIIDCSISNDKQEYLFNFNNTFEIHDDIEVLKRMGMAFGLDGGNCTSENLKHALTLVPPVLKPYIEQMAGVTGFSEAASSTSKSSDRLDILTQKVPGTLQAKEAVSVASTPFPTIKAEPDANDQEVAMVNTQLSTSSSNGTTSSGSSGFISCSSSSYTSSRPHSAGQMSLTPLSSSRSSADAAFDEDDEASCSSRTGTPLTERIFVS